MHVEVLYFAVLRELAGTSRERIEVDEATICLADLLVLLARRHPRLEGKLGAVRVAQNESFADLDARLAPNDVIALIPPVAGG
jgi:molybdopterin converting factor subunit 1